MPYTLDDKTYRKALDSLHLMRLSEAAIVGMRDELDAAPENNKRIETLEGLAVAVRHAADTLSIVAYALTGKPKR